MLRERSQRPLPILLSTTCSRTPNEHRVNADPCDCLQFFKLLFWNRKKGKNNVEFIGIHVIRFFKLLFVLERLSISNRKKGKNNVEFKRERKREKRLGNRRNVLVTARNGLDRSISFAFKSESKYCPAEKSFLPAGGQCSDGEMQSNRRSTLTRKKRPFQSVISAQRIYI